MWRFRLHELRSEMEGRERRRVHNAEIAKVTGVSLPTVSRWLAEPAPSVKSDHVQKLAEFFGVKWYEVIEPTTGDSDPTPTN